MQNGNAGSPTNLREMIGNDTCAPAPRLKPMLLVPEPHWTWILGPKPFVAGAIGRGIVKVASPSSDTEKSTGVDPTIDCKI